MQQDNNNKPESERFTSPMLARLNGNLIGQAHRRLSASKGEQQEYSRKDN